MKRMYSTVKVFVLILGVALSVVASSGSIVATETEAEIAQREAKVSEKCSDHFLTFPAWYRGIQKEDCSLMSPSEVNGQPENKLRNYIMRIVLNILEIMLQAVAYISVGFIIYGGFKYITSPSDSSKIAGARKTIQNAIIGLIISMLSIAIVNLVVNGVG